MSNKFGNFNLLNINPNKKIEAKLVNIKNLP